MDRIIFHCDLNGFYASVECLYNPAIRNKPVAVCGSAEERHGIVLAKNEPAKKAGIKTGEAIWQAKQKCPGLVVVSPKMDRYLRFSKMAREIYEEYTDQVEAFGIDECWLDMTGCTSLFGNPGKVADEVRNKIKRELGITVSVGVSWNKIFSKLGSDLKKPDAVTLIHRENYMEKVWPLPAKDLLYVGLSTAKKLSKFGINTIGGLAKVEPEFLRKLLGKWGEVLWIFANGLDSVPVSKSGVESIIKSIGNSITTPRDMTDFEDVKKAVFVLAESVCTRLRRHGFRGRTVQISVKDTDLGYREYQQQLISASSITNEIANCAMDLFKRNWDFSKYVRAFGVRASRLMSEDDTVQTSLLLNEGGRIKLEWLDKSVDEIRRRFGHSSIQRAILLGDTLANPQNPAEHTVHPISYFR